MKGRKESFDVEINQYRFRFEFNRNIGDVSIEDGIVYLFMQGSCSGCPSSTMTLKDGIETRLMSAIPEIKEVVAL